MFKIAIQTRKIWPSQLYTVEDVKTDRTFHKDFDELVTLKTSHETLKKEHEDLKKETEQTARKTQELTVKETVGKLLKEGVTDKQREFLMARFNPEGLKDLTETGLKAWIESGKKEFAEVAKIFGVTEAKNEPKKDEVTEETPASDDPVEQALATLKT